MKRLVRLYYGFQIFFSLLLWIPIFYEYQKRIGLDDVQIFEIQSIYYIAFCLLEIPTGLLADAWGYRSSLRLGALILVACNLLPVFFSSYASFLAHFLLIALSRSLISGASSAYLYEGLKARGVPAAEYKRIEGNARAYSLIPKVLIWPFIGFLMEWKLSLPYTLTVVGALISVFCAFLLPEDAQPPNLKAGKSWKIAQELGQVVAALPRTPVLIFLMIQGLAAFILPRVFQTNLFQPILSSKGFPVSSYGVLMAAGSVFEALGSGYPVMRALLRVISEKGAVTWLSVVLAILLAIVPFTGQAGMIACWVGFSLAAGLIFPVQKQLMNDAISASPETARYRATVLSVESIFDRAVCAWVVSWIGVYLSEGKIREFLFLSSLVCGVGILLLSVGFHFLRTRKITARVNSDS